MIATIDPGSPHESAKKDPHAQQPVESHVWPAQPTQRMGKKKAVQLQCDDAASDDSVDQNAGDSPSDGFSSDDDHSDSLKMLSLDALAAGDSLNVSSNSGAAPQATVAPASTDAAPVKRIVRRKRKRMSADERRLRHREVQRQFMKRKRARLGEMRKYLRGLESQHRVVQVMNERAMLEKQNMELRLRLASPESGWQWDDSPQPSSQSLTTPSASMLPVQAPMLYPALPPHHNVMYQHIPHPMYEQRHIHTDRPPAAPAPGMPLPWDEILDAVTIDGLHGAFHDVSF